MGYQVPKHTSKRGWKILYTSYEKGKRVYRGVRIDEYAALGVRLDMTREEVIKQLSPRNAEAELARHERRRNKIAERLKTERLSQAAHLPFLDEFETSKLDLTRPKLASYWRRSLAILKNVNLPPKDWDDNVQKFYREFIKHRMSPSYVRQVLPLINLYGKFVAKRTNSFFSPLPTMRGGYYKNVAEAYFEKEKVTGNKASAPLTPELLESKRSALSETNYRWLALSVWFGLRPVEVDLLSQPSSKRTWWVETVDQTKVLWVYQTKLKGVSPEKRVKYIPAILAGQKDALAYLGPNLKRPLQKTMSRVFDGSITLYGGRKGFTDLMKAHGQSFENTSAWLGHTSVVRTYQSYYNRNKVKWDAPT